MQYWEPARQVQGDERLGFLMNTAARGLELEDQRLASYVKPGQASRAPTMQHAFANVGPGLSYWLYETTLVYLIWRAWVEAGVCAALDWSLAQLEGRRLAHDGRGRSYDLAVFCEKQPFLFEAKSWSYYPPKAMVAALRKDAQKLRDFGKTPYLENPAKHILLFGYDSRGDAYNNTLCREGRLRYAGKAVFPASTRVVADDHFIINVFSVIP